MVRDAFIARTQALEDFPLASRLLESHPAEGERGNLSSGMVFVFLDLGKTVHKVWQFERHKTYRQQVLETGKYSQAVHLVENHEGDVSHNSRSRYWPSHRISRPLNLKPRHRHPVKSAELRLHRARKSDLSHRPRAIGSDVATGDFSEPFVPPAANFPQRL